NGTSDPQYGIEDAREAAMNTVESIKASKEQLITYLATIGTLGPLFGLVGTVYSMIGAFMKMADVSKQVDPHEMAGTLSHGLVVTMLGVGHCVPPPLTPLLPPQPPHQDLEGGGQRRRRPADADVPHLEAAGAGHRRGAPGQRRPDRPGRQAQVSGRE